jgi:hypothetical protein
MYEGEALTKITKEEFDVLPVIDGHNAKSFITEESEC